MGDVGARAVRAVTTAGVVAAVVLASIVGLDEWADAAVTGAPASMNGSST